MPVSYSLHASFNKLRQYEKGFNSSELMVDKTKKNSLTRI